MRCPEPILRAARAARDLGSAGGVLEILADDAAFPIDLKSWCRSTGAELVLLEQREQTFVARVRLPKRPEGAPPSPPEPTLLDYRGRRCPEPIIELAKAARVTKGPLEVLADDPAFPLDLKSWCTSSGATAEAISSDESLHRFLVYPRGTLREAPGPAAVPPRVGLASAPASPFPPGIPTARFDLRDLPAAALDDELAQIGRHRPGTGITLLVGGSESQRAVRWCAASGHELVRYSGEELEFLLAARGEARVEQSRDALAVARPEGQYDCVLLVLHNDLESLHGALLLATSASAVGMRTMIFFSFWGLNLLRGERPNLNAPAEPVSLMQRLFKWLMPRGPRRQALGQLNFGGAGAAILQNIMHTKRVQDLPALLATAREQKVTFIACTMSMTVMGIGPRDLEPYAHLEYGGIASFVEAARHARITMGF